MSVERYVLIGFALASVGLHSCANHKLKDEADAIVSRVEVPPQPVPVHQVQRVSHQLATQGLRYQFGGSHPRVGGLDCSGTVHYVLSSLGYRYVPRQSNHQYYWLERSGTLQKRRSLDERTLSRLKPGDLLFWNGTYNTGKRWPEVSHVMVYMGRDPNTGQHWMFGGRGSRSSGRNGNGIDFHRLDVGHGEGGRGQFIGFGSVPGIRM